MRYLVCRVDHKQVVERRYRFFRPIFGDESVCQPGRDFARRLTDAVTRDKQPVRKLRFAQIQSVEKIALVQVKAAAQHATVILICQ